MVEWKNGHTTFTTGPLIWHTSPDGKTMDCISLGSDNGKRIEEVICSVPRTWPPEADAIAAAAVNDEALVPAPEPSPAVDITSGVQKLAVSESSAENSVLNEKKETVVANGTPAAPSAATATA